MDLQLNLSDPTAKKSTERVKKAQQKKEDAKYIPTWEEVWVTGYTSHTGSKKTAILQSKISNTDKERLIQVKRAVEMGELGVGLEDLRKFTKTYALNLYKNLLELRKDATIKQMIANKPKNYHLITTVLDFETMLSKLAREKIVAVDTETEGLEHTDRIVGISFTLPQTDYHCYIPVRHITTEVQLEAEYVFKRLKNPLENEHIGKIFHNALFDMHKLAKEGIEVKGVYMDTLIAMNLLNEVEPSYALKNLATKYGKHFGFEDKSMTYEELFGRGGFQNTPLDIGHIYACKDTHLTYKLAMFIEEHLKKQPELYDMYFNLENKVLIASYEMEKNGLLVDLKFASKYEKELVLKVQEMEKKIAEYFPDINVSSNKQLSEYLYGTLNLPNNHNGSVDAKALKSLSNEFEGVKVLLDYREIVKLLSTYIQPLPTKIWEDGRIHGQFDQAATKTGRFASRNPNMQNLPYYARQMFVAPKGKILVGIDLSAIEPRILASISNDLDMQKPFMGGEDLYSTLASNIFGVPVEECGDGSVYRKRAKVVLLATMYGISPKSLGESLKMTTEEAQAILDDFLKRYTNVRDFILATQELAFKQGYVTMMLGRKRRFHDLLREYKEKVNSREWSIKKDARIIQGKIQRQSVNSVIQGSAAVVLKLGMIACYDYCKAKKDWEFVATIHDENLFYIPEDTDPQEIIKLGECMTKCVTLSVPLKCDIEISKRWGQGVKFSEWVSKGNSIFEESEDK